MRSDVLQPEEVCETETRVSLFSGFPRRSPANGLMQLAPRGLVA